MDIDVSYPFSTHLLSSPHKCKVSSKICMISSTFEFSAKWKWLPATTTIASTFAREPENGNIIVWSFKICKIKFFIPEEFVSAFHFRCSSSFFHTLPTYTWLHYSIQQCLSITYFMDSRIFYENICFVLRSQFDFDRLDFAKTF